MGILAKQMWKSLDQGFRYNNGRLPKSIWQPCLVDTELGTLHLSVDDDDDIFSTKSMDSNKPIDPPKSSTATKVIIDRKLDELYGLLHKMLFNLCNWYCDSSTFSYSI